MHALHSEFMEKLQHSVQQDTFVRLTLSKPGGKERTLQNVYVRPVDIKGQRMLSFTLRYATKDSTQNHTPAEAMVIIGLWLGNDFLNGDLYTTAADFFIQYNKKRLPRLSSKAPRLQAAPEAVHNKEKKRLIEASPANVYLPAMGISGADGQVLPTGQKKFRQINKFIEIIDALLQQADLPSTAHIVDMGAGKGYLTFALYDYLVNQLGQTPVVTGIELRQHLVDFCNDLAAKAHFSRLQFVAQDINDFQPERIDMLIALHACDTATDLAIAKGIRASAAVIVVAPCCHKQIRKQMCTTGELQSILKHGILEERQAELLTDGIRALLLEANGYKTKVFEFISTEHTSKNLMITAVKSTPNPEALHRVEAIKQQFGIEYHYLEKLLADGD